MLSMLAAIGFDPEIRGILVVATGAIVLFGSVWMILATNSGIRLATLIALAGFFAWMAIMGGFWWIRGIGYVGDSVSWHVLDFNREDIEVSSVERARVLPNPASLQGEAFPIIEAANAQAAGFLADVGPAAEEEGRNNALVILSEISPAPSDEDRQAIIDEEIGAAVSEALDEVWAEVENGEQLRAIANDFATELDRDSIDYAGLTDAEFQDQVERNDARVRTANLSQVFSIAPDIIEGEEGTGFDSLSGWRILSTADAGEAQSTAGAAILEQDGFEFGSQGEFKFLDAFGIGGKPTISRDNDLSCTFCTDNLARGWLWITNSARITNPTEYAVVQLQAIDEEALVVKEGQAPLFPAVDEDAQIISVVMVRELGNLRFPPAMVTLGSLLIFVALCYMLHERDKATMARVNEFEAEA